MIINVARKELKSLFASPMGWIILALLMLAFGSFYLQGVNNYFEVMSGSIRPAERVGVTIFVGQTVYGIASFLMLFAVPLLSMGLISGERKSQTLPFLFRSSLPYQQTSFIFNLRPTPLSNGNCISEPFKFLSSGALSITNENLSLANELCV